MDTNPLIAAYKKDEALVAEMDGCLFTQGLRIWWLGQSGFLVQANGQRLLIDPYLSDSLTHKYALTNKPHIRMSERVVAPDLLHHITLITSSHNHTDHLDAETLKPILDNNPKAKILIPEANRAFVSERLQVSYDFPIGLNDQQTLSLDGIEMIGLPASHNEIERDGNGNCRYMGYVFRMAGKSIYHSGDTIWFDPMIDLLKPLAIDLALLPINGNLPERQVAGNLNAPEAALLAKSINAGMVVPCHYDMFKFNTADVQDFVREAEALQQPYRVLKGGECLAL